MHQRILLLIVTFFLWSLPIGAHAAYQGTPVQIQVASASLVAPQDSFVPGEPFFVALKLSMPDGWHTYWQNPGDSGLPATINWSLPEGFTAGQIHWPVPERIEWQGIVNYGYGKNAYLLVPITAPAQFEGDALLTAHASWLVCKDICIPESADVSIRLRAKMDAPDVEDPLFDKLMDSLPNTHKSDLFFGSNEKNVFIILPPSFTRYVRDESTVAFFPLTTGVVSTAKLPRLIKSTQSILVFDKGGVQDATQLEGVLRLGEDAWQIKASYDGGLRLLEEKDEKEAAPKKESGFLTAFIFALIGGLILNAMPCVFPILSLKALKLVSIASHSRSIAARHGIAYTAGVILSFLAVAVLLLVLKQGGREIGWGFQLQSPFFVTLMIFLLFLVGMNLSGLFTLPSIGANIGHKRSSEENYLGSFFTGVLATLVATPCTAPFMAAALGYALGQSAVVSLTIFFALGLGMSLPYLVISLVPALAKRLPKPGIWMEHFKQFLAFPIYATVVWMLWVLALQAGATGVAAALSGIVLLAFLIWVSTLKLRDSVKLIVIPVLLIGIVYTLFIARGEYTYETMQDVGAAPYSEKILTSLRSEKQAVFVNATAAWCLTCKVNETVALSSPKVHEHFKKNNIAVLVADWTKADPEITRFLESHNRQGVPLYVYYAPDGSTKILPQLLTPSTIIEQTQ